PSLGALSAAELAATQARNALQRTRDSASATKTSTELDMRRAVESLTQAQSQYSTAKQQWQYVQDEGRDPLNPTTTDAQGEAVSNNVNDAEAQQYYDAYVRAEAAMRGAEQALAQAKLAYDTARQQEVIDVANAEAKLADATQQLIALHNPTATDIAQRQAALDQATASLRKARQGGTAASVAASQAGVEQAQANLAALTAPPRAVDLAEAQGRIKAAQVALQQAELTLAQATLLAPFAGTIAERTVEVGQRVGAGDTAAPFVLANVRKWKVETDNLSERDVVRVRLGSPAEITFDALAGVTLAGTITAIQPRGSDQYGDITYTVTVTPSTWDERLRWNMSASVAIEPIQP
ncbi:MAG: HlyD family efflux transporter periplasmic adaptor subunit, partial [Chloroflexales bacterium]|nr:HlyD family efflux transporter periplasmic adaptor subunit [Chloroflexales bacterium]